MTPRSSVPADWQSLTVEALALQKKGAIKIGPFGSQLKKNELKSAGIRVYGQENVLSSDFRLGDRFIDEAKFESLRSVQLFPGDVVLTMMGSVGAAMVVPNGIPPGVMDSHLLRIQPDTSLVEPRFLAMVLRDSEDVKKQIRARSQGGIMSGLNAQIVKSLELPVPPLPDQRKIAAILSSVDDAIEKTHAVIDQVQLVKRGLMQELLTRGLPGRHTRFKQTAIGEVPASWDLKKLMEVATVQTGLAKNGKNAGPITVPYMRVANVQDGFLDLTEVKSVKVNPDALTRYLLKPGDVLFTEGGDADKLGRGAVWDGRITPCLHQNHVFVARPQGNLRPMFLSLYGSSPRGKAYFLDCSKQTTNLASINSTQLKNLPVPVPSLEEQDEILRLLGTAEARLASERTLLDALTVAKGSLMSSLLTGELRVTPDAEVA